MRAQRGLGPVPVEYSSLICGLCDIEGFIAKAYICIRNTVFMIILINNLPTKVRWFTLGVNAATLYGVGPSNFVIFLCKSYTNLSRLLIKPAISAAIKVTKLFIEPFSNNSRKVNVQSPKLIENNFPFFLPKHVAKYVKMSILKCPTLR